MRNQVACRLGFQPEYPPLHLKSDSFLCYEQDSVAAGNDVLEGRKWGKQAGSLFYIWAILVSFIFVYSSSFLDSLRADDVALQSNKELTAEQRELLNALNVEFDRYREIASTITDESYQQFLSKMLAKHADKVNSLRFEFDQTKYDELRITLLADYQRVVAWKIAKEEPPLQHSVKTTVDLSTNHLRKSPPAESPRPNAFLRTQDIYKVDITAAALTPKSPISALRNSFLEQHCFECHRGTEPDGLLNLDSLAFALDDSASRRTWEKVYDRVRLGEMPPKDALQPDEQTRTAFIKDLSDSLIAAETVRVKREGRSIQRRLNAYEYENALRDLFHAPWLALKDGLPDDGIDHRFNKSGKSLDVSHVQLSRFIGLADKAIREAISLQAKRVPTATKRFYARDQKFLIKEYRQVVMNTWPDRQNFPLLGTMPDLEVRWGRAPLTVGESNPAKRELEAVGWVAKAFPKWDKTPIEVSGLYKIRYSGYTIWVGANGYSGLFKPEETEKIREATRWHWANIDEVSKGRRDEPIGIYAKSDGQNRRVGTFDLTPEPSVHEIEAWLSKSESLMPEATRLYYPRSPLPTNPNARPDGAPGVAFRWLEIEGPLYGETTTDGYRIMFDTFPIVKFEQDGKIIEIASQNPKQDARKLLTRFLSHAVRRPVPQEDIDSFLLLIDKQLDQGVSFAEAMIAGYTSVLVSPNFIVLEEAPGPLDNHALASRLSFFLWNSPPDKQLRAKADEVNLYQSETFSSEAERMLGDVKVDRFIEAFLDYWLDLRKLEATSPSITLYNDYYLDDELAEAARDETRLYFREMLMHDMPARSIVDSDFTFVNERLAKHYKIPGITGVGMRKVELPPDSPRGGLLTQASVLKVTANGTTTSPVRRGAWITERILGEDIPPPPPVGAVEPDIRGAVTIRQQLEKHRADPSCASCHDRIDPPGFALESFDVFGGWRESYRSLAPGKLTAEGFGKNGQPFEYHHGLPVDSSGSLADGKAFANVRDFKRLLLEDDSKERQIARNLVQQLVIYATGSPVGFADRAEVEKILDSAKPSDYGVRQIILGIVQSKMFQNK